MNNKFLIVSIILFTLGFVLIAQSVATAQTANEFTVPLSDPAKRGKLDTNLNEGSITVKGTGRKDVLVKYTSTPGGDADHERNENDDDDEKDKASRMGLKRIGGGNLDLEVTESNNTIKVRSGSWNHRLKLDIEVPSGMDINLHTHNGGDVIVTNVQGEIALTNFNGDVTALNISGSVVASTYNGKIKVDFDKVTENTPMSYSTFNGDIDLTLPPTVKATFKMKTDQGEILTGFDMKLANTGPVQLKEKKGGVTKIIVDDWKLGEINGGGPEFTIKNYNGDILIRKK